MENEIDDDELAAMLAEDDQEADEDKDKIPEKKLSFAEQANAMTPDELVQLTCSLVDNDKPSPVKKNPTCQLSDIDMGDLLGDKTSNSSKKNVSLVNCWVKNSIHPHAFSVSRPNHPYSYRFIELHAY